MQDTITVDFAARALAEAMREGESGEVLTICDRPSNGATKQQQLASRSMSEPNAGPRPLHGGALPRYEVMKETPAHLVMAYMAAAGLSQKEISDRQGVTQQTVSNLFRQPWFKQRVLEIITEQGSDIVKTLIVGAAVDSVLRLIHLRDNAESESVQVTSAIHLLDRHLGKAPQKVERSDLSDDPHKQEAQLRRQLAELERQEKELTGGSPV